MSSNAVNVSVSKLVQFVLFVYNLIILFFKSYVKLYVC